MKHDLAKAAVSHFMLANYKRRGDLVEITVRRLDTFGVWQLTLTVSAELLRDAPALRGLLEKKYAADVAARRMGYFNSVERSTQ